MDWSVLAHGLGGPKDLPIPPELAIAGAMAALVVSFTVLAVAWRAPRFAAAPGQPMPRIDQIVSSRWFIGAVRAFGMLVFGWAMLAAVLGQDVLINPFFGMFYVWLWVGIVPLSLLFGPFYRAVSPVRVIHSAMCRITGADPELGVRELPHRWGIWPAAIGLFAFVWFELVYPHAAELGPLRLWYFTYLAAMVLGSAIFGRRWFECADPFEVYSTLVGHLSPWGRDDDGALVLRSPLANLARVPQTAGLVGVVSVLFGSTGFDSFRESTPWLNLTQGPSTIAYANLLNNLGLLAFCGIVGLIFVGATMATGVGPGQPRRLLPQAFAHSMVPIIVGYIVAHYLSYFVEVGQQTLQYASDPLSTGANLLGTGNLAVNYWLSYHPELLASTKVLGVVLGHVIGVIAAHDRAIEVLPKRHALSGQLPLLVAMVGFTAGGLYLLFSA